MNVDPLRSPPTVPIVRPVRREEERREQPPARDQQEPQSRDPEDSQIDEYA